MKPTSSSGPVPPNADFFDMSLYSGEAKAMDPYMQHIKAGGVLSVMLVQYLVAVGFAPNACAGAP